MAERLVSAVSREASPSLALSVELDHDILLTLFPCRFRFFGTLCIFSFGFDHRNRMQRIGNSCQFGLFQILENRAGNERLVKHSRANVV